MAALNKKRINIKTGQIRRILNQFVTNVSMMVKCANDGLLKANDGKMLVNDGEMSVLSYHFTIIDEHFTIINEHFTIISLK